MNRWLWLVKWLLVIPHYVVLAFLWLGFVVSSVAAMVVILFTGHYPRPHQRGNGQRPERLDVGKRAGRTVGALRRRSACLHRPVSAAGLRPRARYEPGMLRVAAYAGLMIMTDQYPPFRLDQGGDDPGAAWLIVSPPLVR
ncbi:MAG TPA: hypothetical protein VFG63_03365 [Nocardioidaceae bacterium]|nr:hypothetical protein [Nocardioidaceae bacterium]